MKRAVRMAEEAPHPGLPRQRSCVEMLAALVGSRGADGPDGKTDELSDDGSQVTPVLHHLPAHPLRALGAALCLAGLCGAASGCRDTAEPVTIGVRAVWLDGSEDDSRGQLDAFFECLIHGSTFANFWGGRVKLRYHGSVAITPPPEQLVYPDTAPLLAQAWSRGELPAHSPGERAFYVVFASGVDLSLGYNACGLTALQDLGAEEVGMAFVRNNPLCWPTGDRLRTETQIAMHELAEGIDRLLGDAPCVGDGACEGRASCAEDYCDNFIGLACEGAPVGTWAGCGGRAIDGWVVQTLASAGRAWRSCEACMPCDFRPVPCSAEGADCSGIERR